MKATNAGEKRIMMAMLTVAGVVGIWVATSFIVALSQANWQATEMLRQYLVAIGAIKEFETLVDFYTHIKGVEYLICAAFLGAFPLFYKYVNTAKAPVPNN